MSGGLDEEILTKISIFSLFIRRAGLVVRFNPKTCKIMFLKTVRQAGK